MHHRFVCPACTALTLSCWAHRACRPPFAHPRISYRPQPSLGPTEDADQTPKSDNPHQDVHTPFGERRDAVVTGWRRGQAAVGPWAGLLPRQR